MDDKEITFTATIKSEEGGSGGNWIEFPFKVEEAFGRTGRIKVLCYFDEVHYRGSLVKMGTECHIIGVRKDILAAIGKNAGDSVMVRMQEDSEERTVVPVSGLAAVLARDEALAAAWARLSLTRKNEIDRFLEGAVKAETRARRLEKIVVILRKS